MMTSQYAAGECATWSSSKRRLNSLLEESGLERRQRGDDVANWREAVRIEEG